MRNVNLHCHNLCLPPYSASFVFILLPSFLYQAQCPLLSCSVFIAACYTEATTWCSGMCYANDNISSCCLILYYKYRTLNIWQEMLGQKHRNVCFLIFVCIKNRMPALKIIHTFLPWTIPGRCYESSDWDRSTVLQYSWLLSWEHHCHFQFYFKHESQLHSDMGNITFSNL